VRPVVLCRPGLEVEMIRPIPSFSFRQELPSDVAAREVLLDDAFGACRFTKTSERLREGRLPAPGLAFVAHDGEALVATVRLWNVEAASGHHMLLLGPLAVAQSQRGAGLGGALMRQALLRAQALGHRAVILVGDAPYYRRFGFEAGLARGLDLPGPVDRARFLGCELVPGGLAGAQGLVMASGAAEVYALAA
jgi:predicted N-acetyltransferase YhbS